MNVEEFKPAGFLNEAHEALHNINDEIKMRKLDLNDKAKELVTMRKNHQKTLTKMQNDLAVTRANMIKNDTLREEMSVKEGLKKPMAKTGAWTTMVNKELTLDQEEAINFTREGCDAAEGIISDEIDRERVELSYLENLLEIEMMMRK